MNCPYCNQDLNIKPNGGICWLSKKHTFIYLKNNNETFRLEIEDIVVFAFKQASGCLINLDGINEHNLSELRYKEIFNCKTKVQLEEWLIKVNKEIIFS